MSILLHFFFIVTLGLILTCHCAVVTNKNYWQLRNDFIEESKKRAVGANLTLSRDEERVNEVLMKFKNEEFARGLENPSEFLAGQHFFQSRDKITRSEVFKIIQKIPKGASLHGHDTAMASEEFLFNLTYSENLYGSTKPLQNKIKLRFFKENDIFDSDNWWPLSEYRDNYYWFDEFLFSLMTLRTKNPQETYSDVNSVWKAFENIFETVGPMLCYKPVFKAYFYQVLKELYEDNVKYLEFRGTLPEVYDLEGNTYGPEEVLGFYVETLDKFKKDFPDFWDAKFIYAPLRNADNVTFKKYTDIFERITKKYPEFVIGFDLVGQEDKGKPLTSFASQLLQMKNTTKFFHSGETNWYGLPTDENLFDAILLNTTRIGHGYAIVKHPRIQEIVRERNIGVEVSPISNQVLKLVEDFRNHPGAILLAHGLPVVITNDDPSFWGAKGLSYDWYIAFMGMASKDADLRLLKQLAINSIIYSNMEEMEKTRALKKWDKDWQKFIQDFLVYV